MTEDRKGYILFDWGDTLMRVFPDFNGPMADWPRVETMPHALETLQTLSIGWEICVATNAADSDESEIRRALGRGGVNNIIEKVYCFKKIGFSKPSSNFFEYILHDVQVDAQSVIMVGDSFEVDVLGANGVGMRAIWFNHRSSLVKSGDLYRTIHDLKELPAVINDWVP